MDTAKVLSVYEFSKAYLREVSKVTGETAFRHCCEITKIVKEATQDASLLSVSLLHDILLSPKGMELLQKSPLTQKEQQLIVKINVLRKLKISKNYKDLDFLLKSFDKDPSLLIIRMAHYLSYIRNIRQLDRNSRKQFTYEMLHIYAPIAGKLGFNVWRIEMEDVSFSVLHPRIFKKLQTEFAKIEKIDQNCLNQTRKFLSKKLKQVGIKAKISTRLKSIYSTYRKMVLKERALTLLTDRLALRVIVDQIEDCYRVLGLVHQHMHLTPGKIKDFIGFPKENGYRSIHTVVYPLPGITELPIEIQIRTHEMHNECEYGISAHCDYKQVKYPQIYSSVKLNLIKNFKLLKSDLKAPRQFQFSLKNHFNKHNLVLFDEKNNIYHFKKPFSVMDFAFNVYKKRACQLKLI